MPMMPFIGVRISWLMLARNSLLARLAASASSFRALQRRLGFLAAGDVDQRPLDDIGQAVLAGDQGRAFEHPDVLAVGPAHAALEVGDALPLLQRVDERLPVGGVGERRLHRVGQQRLTRRVAEDAGAGVVAVEEPAVDGGAIHARETALEQEPVALLGGGQLEGLGGELAIGHRRDQRQAEHHEGDQGEPGDAERRNRHGERDVRGNRQRRKAGRAHADVMHDRNRRAHDHRRAQLQPEAVAPLAEVKLQPERHERDGHRQHHRQRDQPRVVVARRAQPHGGHADVMHRGDAGAHEHGADDGLPGAHVRPADDVERDRRRQDGGHQRRQHRRPVIEHRHRQAEGQHPDVVHRPDAQAHRRGAADEPELLNGAARGGHPAGQVQRRVRRHDRNHDGQGDQADIVRPVDHGCRRIQRRLQGGASGTARIITDRLC
jgi:hypothetical protein